MRNSFLSALVRIPGRPSLVKSLYLVAMQNVYCKPATLVKRGVLEISRRATFQNIP